MSSRACTLAHLPSAQRLLPLAPLASLPLVSLMACCIPDEASDCPLVLNMTKSLVGCQRLRSWATATARAAIAEFVPSGFVQLMMPCSSVPSSNDSSSERASSPSKALSWLPSRSWRSPAPHAVTEAAAQAIERAPANRNQLVFILGSNRALR